MSYKSPTTAKAHQKAAIAALAAQPPAAPVDMETCSSCMGSGYSNHPDSGEICAICNGSGGVVAAPQRAGEKNHMSDVAQPVAMTDDQLFDIAVKAWESQTSHEWYTDALEAVISAVRDALASH